MPTTTRRPIPPGTVRARTITPDDALLEYLADHGLRRISKRLMSSGIIDMVAGAIPGIRDILVLGKVKQIERSGIADLVLVDAPATGHTMTFLSSAGGLLDAARGGPIRAQAADVVALLSDPARCQVALVTLPEEMPVNEVVEAAYQLEDRVGIALGPVIVNGCYPAVAGLDTPAAEAAEDGRGRPRPGAGRRAGAGPAVPAHPPGAPGGAARPPGPRAAPPPAAGAVPVHRVHRARAELRRPERRPWPPGSRRSTTRPGGVVTPLHRRPAVPTIDEVVAERSIVICCGSGGVGKTTTAAAFALQAARLGRRACVVTIDPARRLANSLGLDALTNQPDPDRRALARRAPRPHARSQGDLRRPDPAVLGHRRAGRGHQGQPDLPEPHRARCRAPRSTWPWRSSTSWSRKAGSTWWWWTPRRPATPSTSSTPRAG